MTIARTYQCPGTAVHPPHQFRYLHHPSVELDPLPRYCGICGADGDGDVPPEQAVTTPHIARPIAGNVDGMYRAMEEGAEHRANLAMEHFGLDREEASLMKMTDMKDNLRQGDTSDIPVSNPVSQMISQAPGTFGFQDRGQGLSYSQLAHDTPNPAERNPGARAQAHVRKVHAENMRNSGHRGDTTSSMPALETMQSGYRRRV